MLSGMAASNQIESNSGWNGDIHAYCISFSPHRMLYPLRPPLPHPLICLNVIAHFGEIINVYTPFYTIQTCFVCIGLYASVWKDAQVGASTPVHHYLHVMPAALRAGASRFKRQASFHACARKRGWEKLRHGVPFRIDQYCDLTASFVNIVILPQVLYLSPKWKRRIRRFSPSSSLCPFCCVGTPGVNPWSRLKRLSGIAALSFYVLE